MVEIDGIIKLMHSCNSYQYPKIYVNIMGSHSGAVVLNFIVGLGSSGNKFSLTDQVICKKCDVAFKKFKLIKTKMKKLPFLKITREGQPATTHYEVDPDALISDLSFVDLDLEEK